MHKVEKYILELLYRKEILILPQIGTFVVVYSSSKIDTQKKVIFPPSKKIFFKSESNNDNVLANHIAATENIAIALADTMVREYVDMLKTKLLKERKYAIDDFGVFSLSSKNYVLFSQNKSLNFLLDAFGLPEINAVKAKRNLFGLKNKSTKGKIFVYSFISMIILLPLIFLLTRYNYSDNKSKIKTQKTQKEEKNILQQNNKNEKEAKNIINKEAKDTLNKEVKKAENKEIKNAENKEVKEDVKKEVKNNAKYFIVGGCFALEENANKLSEKIKKKGYNAQILKNKDGLFIVSYAGFDNRTDAVKELKKIKEETDASAWLVCQ
ncbi:MAG: SPOR domain-containing protein [Bacteroidales bacterium]|nr:SPOR domain-containing protein [Bacteroidales bacterium]